MLVIDPVKPKLASLHLLHCGGDRAWSCPVEPVAVARGCCAGSLATGCRNSTAFTQLKLQSRRCHLPNEMLQPKWDDNVNAMLDSWSTVRREAVHVLQAHKLVPVVQLRLNLGVALPDFNRFSLEEDGLNLAATTKILWSEPIFSPRHTTESAVSGRIRYCTQFRTKQWRSENGWPGLLFGFSGEPVVPDRFCGRGEHY